MILKYKSQIEVLKNMLALIMFKKKYMNSKIVYYHEIGEVCMYACLCMYAYIYVCAHERVRTLLS